MLFLIVMFFLQDLDLNLKTVFELPKEYKESQIQVGIQDSKKQFWFAVRGVGLLLKNDQWQLITTDDGLISNGITSLLEYSDHSFWAAGLEGVSRLKDDKWQQISLKKNIGININSRPIIFSIQEDAKGNIWIGANGGAAVLRGDTWFTYMLADGLKHQVVHDAIEDYSGQNWYATRKAGLNSSKGSDWNYFYSERNARKIFLTKDNHIWIAAAPGVIEYTQDKWIEHKSDLKQALFPQFEDHKNSMWFYDEQNKSIYIYKNQKWSELQIGLEVDLIFKGDSNRIFILANGTLYKYNS